jgi:SH3-like domain-containing protein
MRKLSPVVFLLLSLGLAACRRGTSHGPVIAVVYAGPAALALRQGIPSQSRVVATAKHGERLEMVQRHRRFMKVRTLRGAEGWTEDYLLLSAQEIAALKEVERRARTLPSQGLASTYEPLNVHTQPNRLAPSFLQVKQGEKVDVVAHVMAPHAPPVRKALIPPKAPSATLSRRHSDSKLAPPAPPPPPANWLALSQTPESVKQAIAEEKAEHAPPLEDWSLVRTAQGESGWVLTHNIFMAIPDDVAQYAEGHRITSYFPLSGVRDGDQLKHNWLWTTISGGSHSYDFDSFRVFIWNLRRHRYETAYIQRRVQGYFPVMLRKTEMATGGKTGKEPSTVSYPGFSVCLDNANGGRTLRNFAFIVNVVRFAGEEPCAVRSDIFSQQGVPEQVAGEQPGPPPAAPSVFARAKALAKRWFGRYKD